MFSRIHLWSCPVLDLCLLEVFNCKFNFTTGNWSVQIVCLSLFHSWQVLVTRNLPIFSMLSNLLAYNCSYCSHDFLNLSGVGCYFSSFTSYFVDLSPHYFLVGELKVYHFFCPFKKPALGFIEFFFFFLWSLFYLFPLWSLLFSSFCWLWSLFVVLSLIILDYRLSCVFDIFLVFLRKACIITSLSELLLLHPIDFQELFPFLLSQGIFQFPLWFLHWPIDFLVASCLVPTCLFFSHLSFCSWFLFSYHCGSKTCLI